MIKTCVLNLFLEAKGKSTASGYKRALEQLSEYTKKELEEEISGSKLLEIVAEDRRRSPRKGKTNGSIC